MADNLQGSSKAPTRPKKSVTCPDCGTGFGRQPELSRHIVPKITCPVEGCRKPFRTDKEKDFMIHVEREHPGLDSQQGKGYFKDHKEVSRPLSGLCTPERPKRTVAESPVIHTPAHQPQSTAMPAYDRSLGAITLSHDPSLSTNTYDEALQSFESYNPSSWQGTMNLEDQNLEIDMLDSLLEELYHDQNPPSPGDSPK